MANNAGGIFKECLKIHKELRLKTDGCQGFKNDPNQSGMCLVCGCHQGFHRKVPQYRKEVFYGKCNRIHNLKYPDAVDGCKEFKYVVFEDYDESGVFQRSQDQCAGCGCDKTFHRNEISVEILLPSSTTT